MIGFAVLFLWHVTVHNRLSKKVNIWGLSVRFCRMLLCSLPWYIRHDHIELVSTCFKLLGCILNTDVSSVIAVAEKRDMFIYNWKMSNLNWEQRISMKSLGEISRCYDGSFQVVTHYKILSFNFTALLLLLYTRGI